MSSSGDFEAPVLAPEGARATSATGRWVYAPTRRARRLGKWRNPIGIVGAGDRPLQRLHRVFGQYIWTARPGRARRDSRFEAPSWAHPMGTDELGRDTLARIIHGAQVSLQVGLISVGIALVARHLARPARRLLQAAGSTAC